MLNDIQKQMEKYSKKTFTKMNNKGLKKFKISNLSRE